MSTKIALITEPAPKAGAMAAEVARDGLGEVSQGGPALVATGMTSGG